MIITSKELMEKYRNYKNPKVKIKREIDDGKYFKLIRGVYEDNLNVEGYLLANIIESPSYLSFEYALSKYGLIPERVLHYTSATTLKKHNKIVNNVFGNYFYTDIPLQVWRYGINRVKEGNYVYLIAIPEKALCDLLYKETPLTSIKQLKKLLFEDLRIDEDLFYELDKEKIISICDLYRKKNLNLLKKMLMKEENDE